MRISLHVSKPSVIVSFSVMACGMRTTLRQVANPLDTAVTPMVLSVRGYAPTSHLTPAPLDHTRTATREPTSAAQW